MSLCFRRILWTDTVDFILLKHCRKDPLEKRMATQSSILAWESHGQRSLVGYSPWGLKDWHDWAINAFTYRIIANTGPVSTSPLPKNVVPPKCAFQGRTAWLQTLPDPTSHLPVPQLNAPCISPTASHVLLHRYFLSFLDSLSCLITFLFLPASYSSMPHQEQLKCLPLYHGLDRYDQHEALLL